MNWKPIALLLGILLITSGCISPESNTQTQDSMMKEDTMMEKKSGEAMEKKDDSMMGKDDQMMGKKSSYIPFTQSAFDQAKNEGKIIFLEFYANWCPTCKAQAPEIEEAFSAITQDNVAGFQVNYNDSETDQDEQNLAREFGITYQHTHVILNTDGTVKTKSLEQWNSDRILQELSQAS